ncbi:hypothetical protein C2W62_41070 [Candidatus Entotheonella serta]|nr:hypothetical protein C2W62_41070 [Candidatus Entotheonella serta]
MSLHHSIQSRLYCPIPSAINPLVDTIHQQTLQWACDFKLVVTDGKTYPRLSAAKFAWLVARGYPEVNLHNLQIVSDWITCVFIHDDLCDGSRVGKTPQGLRPMHHQFLLALDGEHGHALDDPLSYALRDIYQRLREKTSDGWRRRFRDHMAAYFQANRWEAQNRLLDRIPSLDTYLHWRQYTSCVEPCFDLILMSDQLSSEAAYLSHESVRSLARMANNYIAWVNDIFSLDRERQEGNMNNLVVVLQNEYQLSLQAALELAIEMCNSEMEAFLNLASHLPSWGEQEDDQLNRYIRGFRSWMRGNLDWYMDTGRYHVEDERSEIDTSDMDMLALAS